MSPESACHTHCSRLSFSFALNSPNVLILTDLTQNRLQSESDNLNNLNNQNNLTSDKNNLLYLTRRPLPSTWCADDEQPPPASCCGQYSVKAPAGANHPSRFGDQASHLGSSFGYGVYRSDPGYTVTLEGAALADSFGRQASRAMDCGLVETPRAAAAAAATASAAATAATVVAAAASAVGGGEAHGWRGSKVWQDTKEELEAADASLRQLAGSHHQELPLLPEWSSHQPPTASHLPSNQPTCDVPAPPLLAAWPGITGGPGSVFNIRVPGSCSISGGVEALLEDSLSSLNLEELLEPFGTMVTAPLRNLTDAPSWNSPLNTFSIAACTSDPAAWNLIAERYRVAAAPPPAPPPSPAPSQVHPPPAPSSFPTSGHTGRTSGMDDNFVAEAAAVIQLRPPPPLSRLSWGPGELMEPPFPSWAINQNRPPASATTAVAAAAAAAVSIGEGGVEGQRPQAAIHPCLYCLALP